MKKLLTIALIFGLGLTGCGKAGDGGEIAPDVTPAAENPGYADAGPSGAGSEDSEAPSSGDTDSKVPGEAGQQADGTVISLRIVDGAEDGSLVLAGENAGAVYTQYVKDIPIYLDGNPADASALEDGMMAEIAFSGMVMETYPAQLADVTSISVYSRGTEKNPLGGFYDLCGLYLQVLDDLWEKDSGLNEGAVYVSVDLSDAPGELTEGEKSAIAWVFACEHQMGGVGLSLSYQELIEQGYLTEVKPGVYQWEDGVLFSITSCAQDDGAIYSLPTLKFDAQKWRSPLGAYFFSDCAATWPEAGSWSSYSIGGEAIS